MISVYLLHSLLSALVIITALSVPMLDVITLVIDQDADFVDHCDIDPELKPLLRTRIVSASGSIR